MKKSNIVVLATPTAKKPSVRKGVLVFFRTPTAILLALAFAGMQFVGVGFLTWMPTYLHETFDFSLARSGFDATFYHHVAAFMGVLTGAKMSDLSLERSVIFNQWFWTGNSLHPRKGYRFPYHHRSCHRSSSAHILPWPGSSRPRHLPAQNQISRWITDNDHRPRSTRRPTTITPISWKH